MSLSKLYPAPLRKKYKSLMKYCDIEMNPDRFMGIAVFMGLIIAFIVSIFVGIIFDLLISVFFLLFLGIFAIFQLMIYLSVVMRADAKGRFVESVLPDALLIMSMNIKSGMTTDRALIVSARPEFGPLEKELSRAGKKLLAGNELKVALLDMTTRIRSSLFDRTVRLIIEGIESGGELSTLLQQTADDIQKTKLVQNEIRSNVMMHAIFIFFAAGIGAPLLFAISTYIVSSLGAQLSVLQFSGAGQAANMTMQISSGFLTMFALIVLAITSFFGGLVIGVVKNGEEKAGIKFIFILLIMSYSIFFVIRSAVSSLFPVGI